jgi:very-short-patch-repair endonuclease
MRHQGRTVDRNLARIGEGQHGVVSRTELLDAGVTPWEVRARLRSGALLLEYPGVYRVGHRAPSREARYLAAVKACGAGAALSGRAAAHLHGLVKGRPPPPEVIARTERRIEGILTQRSRTLDAQDVTESHKIRVTAVPRTLVDLATVLPPDALARACHEAGVIHSTTPANLEAVLKRRPRSPGAHALRRVLHGDVHVTLSKLERRSLARLKAAGLPLPETNRPAGGRRVDCRWAAQRLTVEVDGYRYHRSRHAWEQDRRREREARLRGDEFRRYTYGDIFEEPRFMIGDLRRLLRRPSRARSRGR